MVSLLTTENGFRDYIATLTCEEAKQEIQNWFDSAKENAIDLLSLHGNDANNRVAEKSVKHSVENALFIAREFSRLHKG